MPQPKNEANNPFAGADPIEDADEPFADLSFVEKTDEEIAAEEAKEEAKKALVKDDEKPGAEKKVEKSKEEIDAEEAEAAAALEADRVAKEAEAAANKDKDKGKKQPMVPKSRLDEVLAKVRVLEQQRDEARAAAAAPKPEKEVAEYNFDAREADYMQAVLDGEKDKALAIRKEIRAAERTELTAAARTDTVEVDDNAAMARAAAEIEANFPQFVQGHADFNEEATNKVVAMRNALIQAGTPKVAALKEAVEFVVTKYGFDEPLEAAKKDDPKVVNLEDKRKKNVQQKVEIQKKQPPEMQGEGERTRTQQEIDLDDMTDAEFDALPEATKRRLRGDF